MLEVQKYLVSGKTFADLEVDFAIEAKIKGDLVILNYSQIDSPKMHPIVQECRGICLNKDTFELMAIAFPRFFNEGEALEVTSGFNWNSFSASTKEDGSLCKIFSISGKIYIQTRGSFADSELIPNKTWEKAIYECLTKDQIDYITDCERHTFVFEYCSPYNQVVRIYPNPILVLLAINYIERDRFNYYELSNSVVNFIAKDFKFELPIPFNFFTVNDVKKYIELKSEIDPSWEGIVVKDASGMRLKIKSKTYLELHHMSGNGNVYLKKNVLPFILKGEIDELLAYFPLTEPMVRETELEVKTLWKSLCDAWKICKDIENQKDFALSIKECQLNSILFRLKREDDNIKHFDNLLPEFNKANQLILKILKG